MSPSMPWAVSALEVLAGRQPHACRPGRTRIARGPRPDGPGTGDEQVLDDGGEQRPRAQHDEVGLADGLKRRLVRGAAAGRPRRRATPAQAPSLEWQARP